MKQSRKKKRSRASKKGNAENQGASFTVADEKDQTVLKNLLEAFSSVSLEEAASAYKEANGDPDKAVEILANVVAGAVAEDWSSTCSTSSWNYSTCSTSSGNCNGSSSSSSNASDVFRDADDPLQHGFKQKRKPRSKKVIASAGCVSAVLGNDYMRFTAKKNLSNLKDLHRDSWSKEEAEQYLCSMLGQDSELSLAVVSDVLCQCGYNLDKALDVLLELSASSRQLTSFPSESSIREDAEYLPGSNDSLTDRTYYTTSHSCEIEFQDNPWFTGNLSRNFSRGSEVHKSHLSLESGKFDSELPQKLLESLFNMPTPKTAEHEPSTMNWRNVVKKITSLGQKFEPSHGEQQQHIPAKGDDYHVLRADAKQHWDSMKCYYQKATTAFTNGQKEHASYLSEQGKAHNRMALEADEKASQNIFAARNRSIVNMITIDLHGQHIKQAMRLLKLHLLFGAYVQSVRSFRVITGCGTYGAGKSKLKTSVINLLQKEGITWSEENPGSLLIKLDGQTNLSFLDSVSDSE